MSSKARTTHSQGDVSESPLLMILGAAAAGVMFGVGLLISGMANPAKVINFLDITGTWDPSLAFVMGGAVIVTFVGYRLIPRRVRPLLSNSFELPTRSDLDLPLVAGAMLFGLGWGIGGYCPGPAWVSLLGLAPGTLVFVVSMLAAMWLVLRSQNRSR